MTDSDELITIRQPIAKNLLNELMQEMKAAASKEEMLVTTLEIMAVGLFAFNYVLSLHDCEDKEDTAYMNRALLDVMKIARSAFERTLN